MVTQKIIRSVILSVGALALSLPSFVFAADFFLSPSSGSYAQGEVFPITINISSVGESVNAVSGSVSFPTDRLEVVSVSKTGSAVNIWVQEPQYSNVNGTIDFEGIILNPGFTGSSGKALTVRFRAKAFGSAKVKFSSGEILANDGVGTNVLRTIGDGTYSIQANQRVEQKPLESDTIKPVSFTMNVLPVTDPTEPRRKIEFKARDEETGIDHYEVQIDNEKEEIWKDSGSHIYETLPLKPGRHTVSAKAFDGGGNFLATSTELTIEPIPRVRVTYYSHRVGPGEPIVVLGEACRESSLVFVSSEQSIPDQGEPIFCDKHGRFAYVTRDPLALGTYTLQFITKDARGAESLKTEPITIVVSPLPAAVDLPTIIKIAVGTALTILILLSIFLAIILKLKKKMHKEWKEAHALLHERLSVLHNDDVKRIHVLPSRPTRRPKKSDSDE